MNNEENLVNAVLKDLDREITTRDLCKAVREANAHRWQPWPWAQRVTERQEFLDRLMREASMQKVRGIDHA